MTINLNDRVRVRFTDEGRRVFLLNWSRKDLVDVYVWECQLWELMKEFGDQMFNGSHHVFVGGNIEVIEPCTASV